MKIFKLDLSIYVLAACFLFLVGLFTVIPVRAEEEEREADPKQVEICDPNGANDYYVAADEINLILDQEILKTRKENGTAEEYYYSFTNGNGMKTVGNLPVRIYPELWSEGENKLELWTERKIRTVSQEEDIEEPETGKTEGGDPEIKEGEGNETEEDEAEEDEAEEDEAEDKTEEMVETQIIEKQEFCFRLDSITPDLEMSAGNGFDVWYTEGAEISFYAAEEDEAASGIAAAEFISDGIVLMEQEFLQDTCREWEDSIYLDAGTLQDGMHKLTLIVRDLAGNESNCTEVLQVDGTAPRILGTGIGEGEMQGEIFKGDLTIWEPYLNWDHVTCRIQRTDRKGNTSIAGEFAGQNGWTPDDVTGEISLPIDLDQEGYYELEIHAADLAGNSQTVHESFALDLDAPVITKLQSLDGLYYDQFRIPWSVTEMAEDLSEVSVKYSLDGLFYDASDTVDQPGLHVLHAIFQDAFAHRTEESIHFVIREPERIQEEKKESAASKETKSKIMKKGKEQSDQKSGSTTNDSENKVKKPEKKRTLNVMWILMPSFVVLGGCGGLIFLKKRKE